jgi:hypothetical protein
MSLNRANCFVAVRSFRYVEGDKLGSAPLVTPFPNSDHTDFKALPDASFPEV